MAENWRGLAVLIGMEKRPWKLGAGTEKRRVYWFDGHFPVCRAINMARLREYLKEPKQADRIIKARGWGRRWEIVEHESAWRAVLHGFDGVDWLQPVARAFGSTYSEAVALCMARYLATMSRSAVASGGIEQPTAKP